MKTKGVGARHKESKISSGVVGYLDICNDSDVLEKNFFDPRVGEIRKIGLSACWVEIAEEIEFEAFLKVWQKLDAASSIDERGLYVPKFSSWLRYQRNRVIISLRDAGMSYPDIKRRIKAELSEDVSVAHIRRIVFADKKRERDEKKP